MKRTSALGVLSLLPVLLSGCGPSGADRSTEPPVAVSPASPTVVAQPTGQIAPSASPITARPADPPPTRARPNPSAKAIPVTITRSGGFAGRTETISVRADGSWTRDGSGSRPSGRLTAAQRTSLLTLLNDPRLAAESGVHDRQGCADAYQWTVAAGATRIVYSDCLPGADRPPLAAKVVDLVGAATG
ncbi:hypothetical protein ACFFWC_07635 [Plantactinospora siamensis]|uniref:DUF3558 domain-containing protein n=1 Tax=Plantactinospora siamensis TaxID=555372 RepID=A0ABV6NXG4_9ACTN